MARKNAFNSTLASTQSLAASFNTTPTMVEYMDNISYQIVVSTSNSVGTFAVQASLDYEPAGQMTPGNAGSWFTLNLSGGTPTVNAANDVIGIDLNQLPYKAIRLAYTSSVAGTGTAAIKMTAKQLGG